MFSLLAAAAAGLAYYFVFRKKAATGPRASGPTGANYVPTTGKASVNAPTTPNLTSQLTAAGVNTLGQALSGLVSGLFGKSSSSGGGGGGSLGSSGITGNRSYTPSSTTTGTSGSWTAADQAQMDAFWNQGTNVGQAAAGDFSAPVESVDYNYDPATLDSLGPENTTVAADYGGELGSSGDSFDFNSLDG